MTFQDRIAKVLEEHGDWWFDTSGQDKSVHCDCGEPISEKHIMFPDELFLSHLAAVLAGVVAEAQAQALREAADELDKLWYERLDRPENGGRDWADGVEHAETMVRARADRIEKGEGN